MTGIFGSLFTAVSALTAQSQSLAAISDNIANVNTVGFKRNETAFSSLVTGESASTIFSPGSVRAEQVARIDQQGILQQSASSTDIAVSGNGFFVVQQGSGVGAEPLYTRAGSFSEDATGILRNTAGFTLLGFPLDQDGNLPPGVSDLSSLVPVDVSFLGGLTQATSSAELALNLDANAADVPFPVAPGTPPVFSRAVTVFDNLGSSQDLVVNFVKHESPTANATGIEDLTDTLGPLSNDPNIDPTDTFDITVGAVGPTTISLNGDLGQLLDDLNGIVDGNGDPVLFAEINPAGQLSVTSRNLGDDITLTEGAGTPLADGLGLTASIGTTAAVPPANIDLLTPLDPNAVPNTEGYWQVEILTPIGTVVESGTINFTGDGQLNAVPALDGSVDIPLTNVDFGNGSSPQNIDFNIGNFTQFAGEFNVVFTEQNGAELGLRTGITINDEGIVSAQFSNGQSTPIYQVPLSTFANPNGLDALSGNVYRESEESGSFNIRIPGEGGAGLIESGTLEGSNVDLADEFSRLIITQRAYSAGTRVITTADEITAELLRLR